MIQGMDQTNMGYFCSWSEVKWGPTLCDPMDCSLPGSSVHGIIQARILEGVAISFSREVYPSQPRGWTQVSRIVDRRFTVWATSKVPFFFFLFLLKPFKNLNTGLQLYHKETAYFLIIFSSIINISLLL